MKISNNPTIIVGMQWGDEGKGKIVDYLAEKSDYIVRFNGGHNAGHTVIVGDKVFKFHNLPSGAVHGKILLIAQGEVINPKILLQEIEEAHAKGCTFQLYIDPRTHIVMPYHEAMDAATEHWKGKNATGSLKLGIGYCYEDKNNRTGIRLEDLMHPDILRSKIKILYPLKKAIIEKAYGYTFDVAETDILKEYTRYGNLLKKYTKDVALLVHTEQKKKNMIFEGAHGTFLDPVFGTYPYTVAPYCIAGSAFAGIGIGPLPVEVVGIAKAYTTRVGNGPFPTEQINSIGEFLQREGQEIGTTSGRKRRCGWLDLVMLRTAVRLNGVTELALTKLDVVSSMGEIRVCTGYMCKGKKLSEYPAEIHLLPHCVPVYKTLTGWQTPIGAIRTYSKLPKQCRKYIEYIEKSLGVPITLISVGADREAIIKH